MQDETTSTGSRAREAWQEVGRRFEALGASLSSALRQAWDDEGNREAVQEVEAGLSSVARAIADAVDEAASSPEGREFRAEAERAVASASEAGKQAAADARPEIVAALKSLRDGLQTAIDELQNAGVKSASSEEPSP